MCYHNNKAQCLLETSEWDGTPIRLSGIALCRSNYTKLLTKEKQVCETGRHFAANMVASFVAILSHCLFSCCNLLHGPSPGLQIQPSGLSRLGHLVVHDICYFVVFLTLSVSVVACLLVSSRCLVSSSSHVFLHGCWLPVAGCWLMPVNDLILASRLYVFCNAMYIHIHHLIALLFVWRAVNGPSWNAFSMFRASVC